MFGFCLLCSSLALCSLRFTQRQDVFVLQKQREKNSFFFFFFFCLVLIRFFSSSSFVLFLFAQLLLL